MKFYLGLFLLLLLPLAGFSQDLIIKHDSLRIEAKVLEISETEIKFKNPEHLNGPTFIVRRSDVYKIKYPNGIETILNEKPASASVPEHKPSVANVPVPQVPAAAEPVAAAPKPTPAEMYQAGRLVALEHYDADGPLWTTAGITFLYPPAGLITGIIIAVIPPNLDEQFYPDMSLLSDPNFAAGYKKQAHKRKVGKTATGLGIGFAAAVVLNLLIGN